MKKLIVLTVAVIGFVFSTVAQSTSPRYTATGGNTGAQLNYKWFTATDATGADSIKLTPNAYSTTVRAVVATDSFAVHIKSNVNAFAGDQLVVIASGTSGKKIKFTGTSFASAGTATLSTVGVAVVTFVFTGTAWAEKSRIVQ